MERVSFQKLSSEEVKRIRQQVVRLKKMGKTGKEIEQLTGVSQTRVSEIWKAYQCNGEAALAVKKGRSEDSFPGGRSTNTGDNHKPTTEGIWFARRSVDNEQRT